MSNDPACQNTNVLVVEDEMVLRMRAVDIVEDAGFTAVEAVSADEALSILEERSDISLLFSDIQMPGTIDGLKLAHAVHDRWPDIKIILVSGQVRPSASEQPTDSKFFTKPLEVKQIIAQLQEMMGTGALQVVPRNALPKAVGAVTEKATRLSQPDYALTLENEALRSLLEQAGIDAEALLKQAGIDAKEREAADRLQTLIVGELHHRIKNNMATVAAIASQTLRGTHSIEHAAKAIDGRLLALSRAHDLLLQVSWGSAGLSETILSATKPYDTGAGQFHVEGPDIQITSGALIALAMTFNELCTNTTKFGALSVVGGAVQIKWSIDEKKETVKLAWTEKYGPAVRIPTRRSFGTRMMETLGKQLKAKVNLDYQPSGFVYTLEVPLSSLTTNP